MSIPGDQPDLLPIPIPGPNPLEGDFARGQRTSLPDDEESDFARGQRTLPPDLAAGISLPD